MFGISEIARFELANRRRAIDSIQKRLSAGWQTTSLFELLSFLHELEVFHNLGKVKRGSHNGQGPMASFNYHLTTGKHVTSTKLPLFQGLLQRELSPFRGTPHPHRNRKVLGRGHEHTDDAHVIVG